MKPTTVPPRAPASLFSRQRYSNGETHEQTSETDITETCTRSSSYSKGRGAYASSFVVVAPYSKTTTCDHLLTHRSREPPHPVQSNETPANSRAVRYVSGRDRRKRNLSPNFWCLFLFVRLAPFRLRSPRDVRAVKRTPADSQRPSHVRRLPDWHLDYPLGGRFGSPTVLSTAVGPSPSLSSSLLYFFPGRSFHPSPLSRSTPLPPERSLIARLGTRCLSQSLLFYLLLSFPFYCVPFPTVSSLVLTFFPTVACVSLSLGVPLACGGLDMDSFCSAFGFFKGFRLLF